MHFPASISELGVIQQITAGIQYLHGRNIVHRDLKPDNIMLSVASCDCPTAVVKVADFGLCKIIPEERSSMTLTSASGTPGWMPPEVLKFSEEMQGIKDETVAEKTQMVKISYCL